MLIEQQPTYVLHARAYRETSLLLECLTQDHGRLGVVARGVRGPRARISRSQLEPFQLLAMDFVLRGEMGSLRGAEPLQMTKPLRADALLAGLYINELVVRLSARQDPHADLYAAYARTLRRLGGADSLAWSLRRFERDLLAALGYGLQLQFDVDDGGPLQVDAWYHYRVESGPSRVSGSSTDAISGAALLALATDHVPDGRQLGSLRRLLRNVISHHLGGAELRAWRVLGAALKPRSA